MILMMMAMMISIWMANKTMTDMTATAIMQMVQKMQWMSTEKIGNKVDYFRTIIEDINNKCYNNFMIERHKISNS